jgi:ElaB/YqjD/DUF883 family membrane-anchored ribosome-binding protein
MMNASIEQPSGARETAEIEREADEIRADMDRTLSALERKFSPSQLIDRSLGYLRTRGPDAMRELGATIKRNPVPILLGVGGLVWLITSVSRRRRSGELEYEEIESTAVEEDFESEAEPITAGDGSGGTGATYEARRSRMREKVASTREKLRSSGSAARQKLSGAMDATRVRGRQAQDSLESLVIERPLALGALAVAIGALIGAAIPATDYERRTVGPMRDRTLDKAKEAGERRYEELRTKTDLH